MTCRHSVTELPAKLFDSCHLVILSSCHLVILSSCHPVILSSCHLVILSSCHLVILSSRHLSRLSPSESAFAQLEEADEGVEVAAVGAHLDEIDAGRLGELAQVRAALAGRVCI